MEFSELFTDVHYLILEKLDFSDLLSFTKTNKYFSILAARVFHQKFSHKIIEIQPEEEDGFRETEERLYIQHPDKIGPFLEKFGPWVHKMKVNYRQSYCDVEILKTISRLINSYCSKSLTEIVIYDKEDAFISQITKPFEHVEYVEIYGTYTDLNNSNMSLSEMFPAMKNLSMPSTTVSNRQSVYQNFSNLIELNANYYDPYNCVGHWIWAENQIEQVLKRNPQIRRLKVHGPTEYTFKVANELLPNLEYIRIEPACQPFKNTDFRTPYITFKHVKTLEIKMMQFNRDIRQFPKSIDAMTFESLEELCGTSPSSSELNWWIKFIAKNKKLKRIYFIDACINDDVLERFLMPKDISLDEISIVFCRDVKEENLILFVKNHQNIKKFNFKRENDRDTSIENKTRVLKENFRQLWIVDSTNDEICVH